MIHLQRELNSYKYIKIPEIPTFTGGAIGYVAYDCISHFEPKVARTLKEKNITLKDPLGIPEAVFMLADTMVVYDHLFQNVKVVSHVFASDVDLGSGVSLNSSTTVTAAAASGSKASAANLSFIYQTAVAKARRLARILLGQSTPEPPQLPIISSSTALTSNVGQKGYQSFVTTLKEHIIAGDIIQAVPSQRISRPTNLHPFNVYRHLRQVNPSPYMFYLDCGDGLRFVGASPETLCKVESSKVYNHAIAGTVRRGKTLEGDVFGGEPRSLYILLTSNPYILEDEKLGKELLASEKDRAEHIMLVDLARNDVNRVCQPRTVKVDHLMRLEKFSHVIHLTSQVSGMLRDGLTRYI